MKILAIDPGTTESAWLRYDVEEARMIEWAKEPNADVLEKLTLASGMELAVEALASYGMPVGAETFTTAYWIGRFMQRWEDRCLGAPLRLVFRREVKLHLTNSARSKDPHVRQALLDKFGPGKELAVGKKATPGPLYGLSGDGWAALGVAVTAAETEKP